MCCPDACLVAAAGSTVCHAATLPSMPQREMHGDWSKPKDPAFRCVCVLCAMLCVALCGDIASTVSLPCWLLCAGRSSSPILRRAMKQVCARPRCGAACRLCLWQQFQLGLSCVRAFVLSSCSIQLQESPAYGSGAGRAEACAEAGNGACVYVCVCRSHSWGSVTVCMARGCIYPA